MIEPIPWILREFTFDQPAGVFPTILERLRGTPARAAELVAGVSEQVLSNRFNGKWSVKEHLGHLATLEQLDRKRLQEFLDRIAVLSAADMTNTATESGNYRETPVAEILLGMRLGRERLIERMQQLKSDEVTVAAIHPRLKKPVRLLDWAYFVAEHDDHHLASARLAIQGQIRL